MKKLEMYCITINNNHAKTISSLGYVPVGLGKNITSDLFIRDNSIVNIYENLRPCNTKNCAKFNSKFKVDKIIELKAGTVKKFNIQVEKIVEIEDL